MASVVNGMTKAEAEKITWDGWLQLFKKQNATKFDTYAENMKERIELRKSDPEEYFKKYVSNQGYYGETKGYIDDAKKTLKQLEADLETVMAKKTSMMSYSKSHKKRDIENFTLDIEDAKDYINREGERLEAIKKSEMEKDLSKHPTLARGAHWIDVCAKGHYNGDVYKPVSPNWCMDHGKMEGLQLPYEMELVRKAGLIPQVAGKRRRSRRRKRKRTRRRRRKKGKKSRRRRRR